MYKYFIAVSVYLLTAFTCLSQTSAPVRFKDLVFTDVTVTKDLQYRTNIPEGAKQIYYQFDLYQPTADSTTQYRPLIIWMHGGGFKFGTKNTNSVELWSKTFAQRGYVCANINYSLSKKHPLAHFSDLVQGCAAAVQDVEQAVAFFKKNCTQFRIDTNKIILAGNSAGGMTALQAVYSSPSDLAKLANTTDTNTYSTSYNPAKIAAVINFWGAIFNIDWLKNTNVPIVCVHGSNDHIVHIDHQHSPFYGSEAIHKEADSLHIPNRIKIYQGFGHELQKHFNPFNKSDAVKQRWLEAGQFAADFLYGVLYK